METLTNGFYFDVGLIIIVLALVGAYKLWRWMTFGRYERWHRRQIERHLAAVEGSERRHQHLAEAQRPSFPQGSHEGDWDWPRRSEQRRLLGSGQ